MQPHRPDHLPHPPRSFPPRVLGRRIFLHAIVNPIHSAESRGCESDQNQFRSLTIAPGQHATEVEPHMVASGSTLVAAFQAGRIAPGGATNIGWATSTDGGSTWTHGFLPGLTTGEGPAPMTQPAIRWSLTTRNTQFG